MQYALVLLRLPLGVVPVVHSTHYRCVHLSLFFFFKQKTAYDIGLGIPAEPLFRSPPETELSRQMTTSTTSIDIMGLQAAYANLHTDQERDYFMQRYHDVISSFGGKTSYDADNRPLLVMRSNLWASGYDVDGTD